MRRSLVLLLCTMSWPVMADVTSPSGKTVDCYCTDTGGTRVELGQTICLAVDGRIFQARCEMSQNVPMWRETGSPCLGANLAPSSVERLLHRLSEARDAG